MKKILFYIDSMQKGGANRVMANLTDFFANKEYSVVLVNDISFVEGTPEYAVNPRVKRIYLGVKSGSAIISNFRRISELRKIIKKEHPCCVVSFMGPPNFRMLLSTFFLKCRKVISVRNDPTKEYGSARIKRIITNLIFLLADGCVFQTNEAADYFNKIIKRKAKVILNPVDNRFYITERDKTTRNIVTVGRLYSQKNHKLLIDAFSYIANEFPDENLIIYGEGVLRSELEKYIDNLRLGNRISLPGNVVDIFNKLKSAKLFILSSDFEGMPNALMEAMACGVPVISTDCPCGGPRMLLGNNEYGILVPCNDKEKMADAIRKIMNKEMIKRYEMKSKIRANDFRPDLIYKQWEDYLMLDE